MAEQCKGKTKEGKRCKKTTTSVTQLCHLHRTAKEEQERELPVKGFPDPDPLISDKQFNKLATLVKKGPKKDDEIGYIYIYYLPSDSLSYYKIGRTTQKVTKRLKQQHPHAKLFESYRVSCNKFCERVIHLFLDPWRVYRYKLDNKQYCTVWKHDGKPVTKGDAKKKKAYRLQGKKKEIEWFHHTLDELCLLNLVQEICKKYRNL